MIDKKKDQRFTQVNQSLVTDRKTQITILEKEYQVTQKQSEKLKKKLQETYENIKKYRVIEKTKGDYKYQIICPCGNVYNTNSDPYARLKAHRPFCRNCKERLE